MADKRQCETKIKPFHVQFNATREIQSHKVIEWLEGTFTY